MSAARKKIIFPILLLMLEILIGVIWVKPLAAPQEYSYGSEDLFTDTDRYGDDGRLGGILQPGFYVDHSIGAAVVTPEFPAMRGSYRVRVAFDSNGPSWSYPRQTASRVVAAEDANELGYGWLVDSEEPILAEGAGTVSYRADIRTAGDFRVVCQIDPGVDGQYLLIKEITVTRMTKRSVLHDLVLLFILFVAVDLFLWFGIYCRERFDAWRREYGLIAAFLTGIIFFACLPLMERGFFFGDDLYYHMRRIIYLAEGIASGTFPVRIQAWGHGYGYAVGVGYGDLFLLPSALLYLAGFSVTAALKFYVFLMTVFAVLFSYHACARISGSRMGGITGSAFYTLLGYRLSMAYSGSMFGEFGAFSFLPLVILGLWGCLRTRSDERERRKAENTLALALACIVGSHVISTLISGVVILILCILWIRRTLSREVLPALLRAAGKTILLSLWFLVPLADYMLTMDLDVSRGFVTWMFGLRPAELFFTLPDAAGVAGGYAYLGYASVIILAVSAGLLLSGMADRHGDFRTADGVKILILETAFLWFSTKWFPLYAISRKLPKLYHIIETIQFSWRVLNYASVFLAILAAVSVRILQDGALDTVKSGEPIHRGVPALGTVLAGVLVAVCFLQGGEYLQDVVRDGRVVRQLSDTGLADSYHAEFSLRGDSSVLADTVPGITPEEGLSADLIRRRGTTVTARIDNPTDEVREARFPLWAFRGYRAYGTDDASGRERLELYPADDQRVAVSIPPGFSGEVTVRFCEPWFWRLSEFVSLVGWILLITDRRIPILFRKHTESVTEDQDDVSKKREGDIS